MIVCDWNPGRAGAARAWALAQRQRHFEHWPWLAEEIRGIADGSGLPLETIELLNFRAWQYYAYGAAKKPSALRTTEKHEGELV